MCSKDCEVLAEKLNTAGITATHYHADMEPRARATAHSAWSEGQIKVCGLVVGWLVGWLAVGLAECCASYTHSKPCWLSAPL